MSAAQVAHICYDKYHAIAALPVVMRDDIEQLATHFHGTGELESVFIDSLIPWDELVGDSNQGHQAVADFLITRASYITVSANVDTLIEQSAWSRKKAIRGALDGHEANAFRNQTSPLLKFHGCMLRGREVTVWTRAQLADDLIRSRVESCVNWMRMELPDKDLVVIGFWTDWEYLNNLLVDAITTGPFRSVTVIDPATTLDLQTKAETLWRTLNEGTDNFQHVQASGADALEELRIAFSRVWLRRFYSQGRSLVEQAGLPYAEIDPDMSCEDLYRCRCDAEGVPYNHAACKKEPSADNAQAAFLHHLLSQAGAIYEGPWRKYAGRTIRIIHGAGQDLNSIRERYKEPPALREPDIVAVAGAMDLGVPGKLIRSGTGRSVVRPRAGGRAQWVTLEGARLELGL
jgi:hypothetical protein